MLIKPEEIHVHKIKNEMLSELKPSVAQPLPLSDRKSIARGLNLTTLSNGEFLTTNDFNN